MPLHQSGEDYLEAILVLKQERGMVRSIDVAQHLGFSKPSVSRAMSILKSDGLVEMDRDGGLELTEVGGKVAEEIYRRVWDGEAAYACENTVMVHIRRIREKIELNPRQPEYLKVVWGIGYKIEKK